MSAPTGRGAFMRIFSSALASQALLSAASFIVGLLLIRHTSDIQYAHYILVIGAIILAVSLQNAFIAPVMINRMTRMDSTARGELTGGLYREQRRVIVSMSAAATSIVSAAWVSHLLDSEIALLALATIAAIVAALRREYFRMVLLAYRRAHEVLRGDSIYCPLLVAGVLLASVSPAPATLAVLVMAGAATLAGVYLSRALRHAEAWNTQGTPGILREIAPLGAWSTAGAAIHWSFSQGYPYLVAAILDIRLVAAIAATRLMVMPINLLSNGIGSLMLPMASRWLHDSGAVVVLRRLLWFALSIAAIALVYFGLLWLLRDWIFEVVLKKQFPQRDLLLILWASSFILMAMHQQLLYLLLARERFRLLTSLALVSAVTGLCFSYWGMLRFGAVGAPMGIMLGELVNAIGIVILCLREAVPDMGRTAQTTASS